MIDFSKELNEAQLQAVTNYDGPSLVVAGAGSGKTRVLTYRIAYMIAQGVIPSKIMGLTFTNKAANEMKERIIHLSPKKARSITLGTFHSVFGKILRNDAKKIGYTRDYTIYDTDDSKTLIRHIVKDLQLDNKIYKDTIILKRISASKNRMITAQAYNNNEEIKHYDTFSKLPELGRIYLIYEERCKKSNAMDFDDMLLNTYILFKNNSEVVSHYQTIFDYFLVDEFQDTNTVQYEIMKMIASQSKNLCCVGDDAQSIYSFRGAQITNIKKFYDDFQAKIYRLEQNYRSTQTIVNAANTVIKKNENQIPKNLFSENKKGNPILLKELSSDMEEAYFIADDIKLKILTNHYQYGDFAILYRTNAQSRVFEEALRRQNIPYRVYGGTSFYQRAEIKDILAYLSVILNPHDDISLLRIFNFPKRGIGKTTIEKLQKNAKIKSVSLWEILKNAENENLELSAPVIIKLKEFYTALNKFIEKKTTQNIFEITDGVLKTFGILTYYNSDEELIEKKENVEEFLNSIYEFVSENDGEEESDISLSSFLQTISLITDMDKQKKEDINTVKMMTVHSAKGLEFPIVYIVGMEDGLFPSGMTLESPMKLQEERRLFYVAMTRAKEELSISFCQTRYKYNQHEYPSPSRFLKDIEKEFYNFTGTNPLFLNTNGNVSKAVNSPYDKHTDDGILPNFKKVNQTNSVHSFTQDDIKVGMQVSHSKFGEGKVLNIEGQQPNTKAIIFFKNVGEKTLLLKFAKLKIIDMM